MSQLCTVQHNGNVLAKSSIFFLLILVVFPSTILIYLSAECTHILAVVIVKEHKFLFFHFIKEYIVAIIELAIPSFSLYIQLYSPFDFMSPVPSCVNTLKLRIMLCATYSVFCLLLTPFLSFFFSVLFLYRRKLSLDNGKENRRQCWEKWSTNMSWLRVRVDVKDRWRTDKRA